MFRSFIIFTDEKRELIWKVPKTAYVFLRRSYSFILRTGSHFDISISISRHTQTQYDVDNWRLLLEISLIKGANYLHLTASAYVSLCVEAAWPSG